MKFLASQVSLVSTLLESQLSALLNICSFNMLKRKHRIELFFQSKNNEWASDSAQQSQMIMWLLLHI